MSKFRFSAFDAFASFLSTIQTGNCAESLAIEPTNDKIPIAPAACGIAHNTRVQQVSEAGWRARLQVEVLPTIAQPGNKSRSREIILTEPGASFIQVHFGKFALPKGVTRRT